MAVWISSRLDRERGLRMDYVALIEKLGEIAQYVCPVLDIMITMLIGWATISLMVEWAQERKRMKRAHRRHEMFMREYRIRRNQNGR